MIVSIEQVIRLQIHFPSGFLPRQFGIYKGIGLIIVHHTIEIGIRSYTILPTEVYT